MKITLIAYFAGITFLAGRSMATAQNQSIVQPSGQDQTTTAAKERQTETAKRPHPGNCFDLRHWKLTLPIDSAQTYQGHPQEIQAQQLADGFNDLHFGTGRNDAMVFWCPVSGATTEGAKYPRCELREMLKPGNPRHNWPISGTHVMEARCRLLAVPSNTKVVIGQIHSYTGKARPLVKLQYYKGRIEALVKLSPDKGKDKKLTFGKAEMNRDVAWKIKLEEGRLSVVVNGMTKTENMIQHDDSWSKQTFYFKAGAYPQDNEGDASEGARVAFSKLNVRHSDD